MPAWNLQLKLFKRRDLDLHAYEIALPLFSQVNIFRNGFSSFWNLFFLADDVCDALSGKDWDDILESFYLVGQGLSSGAELLSPHAIKFFVEKLRHRFFAVVTRLCYGT